MLLSDRTIRAMVMAGDIGINPQPMDHHFQPISVDLSLGSSWIVEVGNEAERRVFMEHYVLRPRQFVLATTYERIKLANHVAGFVHGKSTWARRGLVVESAGLVDPGFDGTITLELFNLSDHPLRLSAGFRVCQISFQVTDVAVQRPYGSVGLNSHYQGQVHAEPARG
jgi:dCTP deaminase